MRGIFTIPVTPFDESGQLHLKDLEHCVEFCIEAGAHGLVAPVNAGEFSVLSDSERRRVVEVVVGVAKGQVPVVAGVSGVSGAHAAELARHARATGADAVIAMPPYTRKASEAQIRRYYREVASAAELPLFVQNFAAPLGTPMPASFLRELVADIDGVDYIKEETQRAGELISELLQDPPPSLRGVMGGLGGRHLIEEYRRGACGTMPAGQSVDVHVAIWSALEGGDVEAARAMFTRLLPLLNLESRFGPAVSKQVLRRRGVITSTTVRDPLWPSLDSLSHAELTWALDLIVDLFTTRPWAGAES